jgi:hypothetical protein
VNQFEVGLIIKPSETLDKFGFITTGLGTHSSRTMMLAELQMLLSAYKIPLSQKEYREAIVRENVLLKQSESTRVKSYRHLRELYSLDPTQLLFRALIDLWNYESEAQPLIAVFCALSRDPSLRATVPVILGTLTGDSVLPQQLAQSARGSFAELSIATLDKIGRNTASSWTQSGHLKGRSNKIRKSVQSHSTSVAYALFLGYLTGARGEALFETTWCRLLDASIHTLRNQATIASQHGWLEYRHSGGVTDITFRYLLRETQEGMYE